MRSAVWVSAVGWILLALGSLVAQTAWAVTIGFEAPDLGTSERRIMDPYAASGVTFTAEPSVFGDQVVGLVRNRVTSACAEPRNSDQKLGTGRRAFGPGGSVGLGGFQIRATFSPPLAPTARPVFVSVEFQTVAGAMLRLRLFDSSGALVASATEVASPPDGTCGFPGSPRARRVLVASSMRPVAFAMMDVQPGGRVFVIDNFSFGMDPGPMVYAVNHLGPSRPGEPTISLIDSVTHSVVGGIVVRADDPICLPMCGGSAHDVAFTPDGHFAYVTHACSPWIIDVTTSRLVAAVDTRTDVNGDGVPDCLDDQTIEITPDGRYAYIVNNPRFSGESDITVLDLRRNLVVAYIDVGEFIPAFYPPLISPDSRFVYVMFRDSRPGAGDQGIAIIDVETQTIVARIAAEVPGFPPLALSPDGRALYVGRWNAAQARVDGIDILDTSARSVAGTIPIRSEDFRLLHRSAVTADGAYLYAVVSRSDDRRAFAVIDLSRRSVVWVQELTGVASVPSGFAVTPDGLSAYLSDVATDSIHVVTLSRGPSGTDPPTWERLLTLRVGTDPLGIRVRPAVRLP